MRRKILTAIHIYYCLQGMASCRSDKYCQLFGDTSLLHQSQNVFKVKDTKTLRKEAPRSSEMSLKFPTLTSGIQPAARQKQITHGTYINAVKSTFSVLLNSNVGTIQSIKFLSTYQLWRSRISVGLFPPEEYPGLCDSAVATPRYALPTRQTPSGQEQATIKLFLLKLCRHYKGLFLN
jgi:hypothetical protein